MARIYLIVIFIAMSSIFAQLSENEDSNLRYLAVDPLLGKQFSDFLNGLYKSTVGDAVLTKCAKPYNPDTGSHAAFVTAFKNVQANVNLLISKKAIKQITGDVCAYKSGDNTIFTDATKTDVPTNPLFVSLIIKTVFGKAFLEFSKCIGTAQLYVISDQIYIDEMLAVFSNADYQNKLFNSFCSINNMFSFLKSTIDDKMPDAYLKMGQYLHDLLVQIKPNYDFITKKSLLTFLEE